MSINMTCRHCGEVIEADNEDDLVTGVQGHARSHEGGPAMTREHILARFHRLQSREHHEP